ncbi:MAG TPA: GxxExxY protein [Chitinophagaceae bacterium]
MSDNFLHSNITSRIIKAYYTVFNKMGYGFLEKVYENALLIELRKAGLSCKAQMPIKVYYDQVEVGYYLTDIIVDHKVIIEIKAAESLCEEHEVQLVNYLRATDIEVGILLNFGKQAEFKRKVFCQEYKHHNQPSKS